MKRITTHVLLWLAALCIKGSRACAWLANVLHKLAAKCFGL